jgi:hypothetical protein
MAATGARAVKEGREVTAGKAETAFLAKEEMEVTAETEGMEGTQTKKSVPPQSGMLRYTSQEPAQEIRNMRRNQGVKVGGEFDVCPSGTLLLIQNT